MTAALDLTHGARKPLCIDLFCGLFGWSSGFVQEGWDVIGFDIEDMHANFGIIRRPEFRLVIQNCLTIHGSQFRNADCLVASPPCQRYSFMAMPWRRGKAQAAAIRADETGVELERLNALFNSCFRIQAEASAAAGRRIPLIVENVRGAIPWVGRSRWNFGSYHLWGDVPALMPATFKASKMSGHSMSMGAPKWNMHHTEAQIKIPGFRFDGSGRSFQSASVEQTGVKAPGMNWSDRTKGERLSFTDIAGKHAAAAEGRKGAGAGAEWFDQNLCQPPSKSPRRKAASAMIAKIPEPLARWIARAFHPDGLGARSGEAA